MKTILFSSLGMCILFFSCTGSKEARTIKKSIDGNWNLESVTIQGNNNVLNAKVFNEADNTCFIGSSWNFVSNNGTGSYTLLEGKGTCTGLTRKIHWSIYEPAGEEKKFQFKRLDENGKPMDDNNGYRFTISSLTQTNMQLISRIDYENKPIDIVYNFVKK